MTDGWPSAGYDPTNAGHGTGVDRPEGDVAVRWSHDLGGKHAYAAPVVEGDDRFDPQVYVHGLRTQERAPGSRAVAREDGSLRWAVDPTPSEGYRCGSPVAAEDHVVLPGAWVVDRLSGGREWRDEPGGWRSGTVADGVLYRGSVAHDVATGERCWTAVPVERAGLELPHRHRAWEVWDVAVGLAPAVADGVVYTAGLGVEGETTTEDGDVVDDRTFWGAVFALHAEDGSVRWSTRLDTPAAGKTPTVVADGTVYVVDTDGRLRTFDAADGTPGWTATVGEVGSGESPATHHHRPTVAEGRVLVPGAEALVALDAAHGETVWRLAAGGTLAGPPAVVDGVVYAALTDGTVVAADLVDGRERWRVAVDDQFGSGPVVAGGSLFVAGYAVHRLAPRA